MVRNCLIIVTALFVGACSGMSPEKNIKNKIIPSKRILSLQDICARVVATDFEQKESYGTMANDIHDIISANIVDQHKQAWWSCCQRKPLNHQPLNVDASILSAALIFSNKERQTVQAIELILGILYMR